MIGPDRKAEEQVVLVNEHDQEVGVMEKLAAHRTGSLHRAFSVFVFNREGQLLLQRRANGKYHGGGLWTNTCCSHPRPGEQLEAAAHRRLQEELGFECALVPQFTFIYKADVGNGLIEHEFDHVFFGDHDGEVLPQMDEVSEVRWISMGELADALRDTPQDYTVWLQRGWPQVWKHFVRRHHA